jgi:hypothetical protein
MEIDHVVLVARTRDDAEDVLSKAGLAIARGRAIPGLGVSNLVVPLGKTLLEITYPNGEPAAAGAPPLIELHQKAFAAYPSEPRSFRRPGWCRSRTRGACENSPLRTTLR